MQREKATDPSVCPPPKRFASKAPCHEPASRPPDTLFAQRGLNVCAQSRGQQPLEQGGRGDLHQIGHIRAQIECEPHHESAARRSDDWTKSSDEARQTDSSAYWFFGALAWAVLRAGNRRDHVTFDLRASRNHHARSRGRSTHLELEKPACLTQQYRRQRRSLDRRYPGSFMAALQRHALTERVPGRGIGP